MASALTLVMVLVPVISPFTQTACASKDIEERRDPLECDRRSGPFACVYPEACHCNPYAAIGVPSGRRYRYQNGRCVRGAFTLNCNGFSSLVACYRNCLGA
ncbi:uncharacterized protein LOC119186662 [Rhipicephalus microplus]|uniref:uncharacterized protein LOC119186662 n=1 Tax=Rhipicephalus microplus TaxID=6941 RepID=UPI003F6BC811